MVTSERDWTETPEPGFHPDTPFEEYLRWDAFNAGLARAMDRAAAMAHYRRTHPEMDKPAYLKGRLFHSLISDPDAADREYIAQPATYIAKGGEEKKWHGGAQACKEWVAEQRSEGREVVSADVHAEASGMAAQVRQHPRIGPLLAKAELEVSVVWDDPQTGVRCKARFDLYKPGASIVVDPKGTTNAQADPFFGQAYRYGYHIQAAMYVDALKILAPSQRVPWFCFVAVETYPPHLMAVYDVRDDPDSQSYPFLQYGRAKYRTALQQYVWCIEHDEWPGYGHEHRDMLLPPWVKDAEDYGLR